MTEPEEPRTSSRRAFVLGVAATAGAGVVAACGSDGTPTADPSTAGTSTSLPGASSPAAVGEQSSTTGPGAQGSASGPARFVSSGPAGVDKVALTFHTNGDVALAHQLLDLLDARSIQVTAFVVGTWLDQHPDWAKRLVDGGHELANHTYTHPTFAKLAPSAMADEITRCRDVLLRTGPSGGAYFRPSGTANGTDSPIPAVLAAAGAAGYPTVLGYDVDPADYKDPGATVVSARTIAALHPGAIVSLHFGHAGTIQALPAILDALQQRGLAPVRASDLLA